MPPKTAAEQECKAAFLFLIYPKAFMTTTVHIAVTGNKQVVVETQSGKTRMQPGSHHTFSVHGEGVISVKEEGDFISAPSLPLVRPYLVEQTVEA